MFLGAAFIVMFIGWFYLDQLNVPEAETTEETIAQQVRSTQSEINLEKETNSSLQKTDSQGTVAIQITLIPEKSSTDQLLFEIAFNTHSGDLLQYEVDQLAILTFGTNKSPEGTFKWELANEDTHHLVGYLTWNGEVMEEPITLELENIEYIPSRSFIWEKNELTEIFKNLY